MKKLLLLFCILSLSLQAKNYSLTNSADPRTFTRSDGLWSNSEVINGVVYCRYYNVKLKKHVYVRRDVMQKRLHPQKKKK